MNSANNWEFVAIAFDLVLNDYWQYCPYPHLVEKRDILAHAETTQHQSSGSIWSRVNNPLADIGWLYLLTAGIMLILEVHYT